MFPIIPQYVINEVKICESDVNCIPVMQPIQIPKPEATTTRSITSKPKVVVTSVIEKDNESLNITASDIINEGNTGNTNDITIYAVNNTIKCNSKDWSWLKHIPLAEDCHSYNIELFQKLPQTTLQIKAVRRITPNEKLILWFSHELILLLQIPHLSLNNIQGEKQYNCHRCPFQCEMPNPLKIHLALECGILTKSLLWRRLLLLENRTHSLTATAAQVNEPTNTTHFAVDTNITPQKRNSAFKPYKTISKANDRTDVKNQAEKIRNGYSNWSNIHLEGKSETQISTTNILYKQATELETIVSNLGRFKTGHLCIYCGKVYSRKYGLKIHIRTHTGFKPLRCKYCCRPFGDPSNLNKHVRLHLGDTVETFKNRRKKRS